MNTQKSTYVETEAEDHATETRYAVEHHGKELHPEPRRRKTAAKSKADEPWQID